MSKSTDDRTRPRRPPSRLERANAARRAVERILSDVGTAGVHVEQWRQPSPLPSRDGRVLISLRLIVDADAVDREIDTGNKVPEKEYHHGKPNDHA